MNVTDFLNSKAVLLSGIGTLFLGIAALLPHIYQLVMWIFKKKKGAMKPLGRIRVLSLLVGIFFLTISIGIFTSRILSQEQPLNVQLTSQAWDAFNKDDYERAIVNAKKCINEFRGSAEREQKKLEMNKVDLPPTGKVSNKEKEIILARGLLNDVATCFYISGRSAENIKRKEEAKQAYEAASKYTYARCWDPKGWFWSPSEAALDRLDMLK